MLELPPFELLKKQPDPPHVARVVVQKQWPNEHGTMITYTVHRGRTARDWWISASSQGWRMSNTLHTTVFTKGVEWISAVDTGDVKIKRNPWSGPWSQ